MIPYWSDHERAILVAGAELNLTNAQIASRLSGRTAEAVKKYRKKLHLPPEPKKPVDRSRVKIGRVQNNVEYKPLAPTAYELSVMASVRQCSARFARDGHKVLGART